MTAPTPRTGGSDTDSQPIPAPAVSQPLAEPIVVITMSTTRPPTFRQRVFVCYWLETALTGRLNASAAARRAGYSPKSAHVTASRLLRNPRVRGYLREIVGGYW
jgi:hypothetical protein